MYSVVLKILHYALMVVRGRLAIQGFVRGGGQYLSHGFVLTSPIKQYEYKNEDNSDPGYPQEGQICLQGKASKSLISNEI